MMQSYQQISEYQFYFIIDVVGTFNVLKDRIINIFVFIGIVYIWWILAPRVKEVIRSALEFAKVSKQRIHKSVES